MKLFTSIILEKKELETITMQEMSQYVDAIMKTKRSKDFSNLLWLIGNYPVLFNKETLEDALKGRDIETLDVKTQKDIITLYKKIGVEAKLLPQFLTQAQRQAIINKQVDVEDFTLDLESNKGRNEIAKKYAPLIEKILNQVYKSCDLLPKEELRSAGLLGLVNAMNEYKNPEEMAKAGKSGSMSFTNYAAYRIRQAMLDELTENGRNVQISGYMQKKREEAGLEVASEISIDQMFRNSEDDQAAAIDRFAELGEDPEDWGGDKKKMWELFCKNLEKKFSARDCNVLYRVWGVNGFKQERVKDIAKELNISAPAVVQAIKRIFAWAKTDKDARECLSLFESVYVCKKLSNLCENSKQEILESFLFDDVYLLFESINQWKKGDQFQKAVNKACDNLNVDDALYILNIIGGLKDIIEKEYKSKKCTIIAFLINLYLSANFKSSADEEIKDELRELKAISDKFMIKW